MVSGKSVLKLVAMGARIGVVMECKLEDTVERVEFIWAVTGSGKGDGNGNMERRMRMFR